MRDFPAIRCSCSLRLRYRGTRFKGWWVDGWLRGMAGTARNNSRRSDAPQQRTLGPSVKANSRLTVAC